MRCGWRSQPEQRQPYCTVRHHEYDSILGLLRQGEELLTQCLRRLVLGNHVIITMQATQHGAKLVRIFQILTELLGTSVDLFSLRNGIAFGGMQRCPEGDE